MIGILLLTATDAAQKAVLEGVAVSVVATAQFGAEAHLKDKNKGEFYGKRKLSKFFCAGIRQRTVSCP